MAFGNPYGEDWSNDLVLKAIEKLKDLGVRIIALSDTIGLSMPGQVSTIFDMAIENFPDVEFGAHFHTTENSWEEKLEAAFTAGVRRFDGALNGYGGCPMAAYQLVGNIATENIISFLTDMGIDTRLDSQYLKESIIDASSIFPQNITDKLIS